MHCKQDRLFGLEDMLAAETELEAIHTKMKAGDKFSFKYNDVPHSMTIAMQDDAFAWLEKWLK